MTNNSALLFMSKFICIFLAILRSSNSSPFGPPYPITAAFFQDRFSKTEWNKTLTDFKEIGGDTVLLRAPAIKLTTEDELEQDPDFQWCGDFNGNEFRIANCTESAKKDLAAFNITVKFFATFKYEENYIESAFMQCPQYDRKIVTSRVYYRLVLPLDGGILGDPCNLNNSSVMVLFTTFAGVDPHQLLLQTAQEHNISVFFGLPHAILTYDRGYPEIQTLLLTPYMAFIKRTTYDHKVRYSNMANEDGAILKDRYTASLYSVLKGYYIDDHFTLSDIYLLENYLIKEYYKPLVGMVQNVSKVLTVGVSVQMNKYEMNSTMDDNVKGFEALAKAGVDVIAVDEGRGRGMGGYFWETELMTPIAVADKDLDTSLHYQYPSMKANVTFDDVFWTSIQKMFEALGTARDNLEKAGTNTDLWLTIDAFEYLHDDPCLPVDRAGSGLPEMLNRVTKSRIDWALTAASWNVQKVASLAFDPGFTCRTNKHPSPLVFQIKQDKTRPIIAKCFFHSNFNRSVVVIGYNLEAETQGFTVNWPSVDGKRHISNVYGYYFELDWGDQHHRVPSLEYTQLYDPNDVAQLRDYGWVKVSVGGGYHSCSFTYDFRGISFEPLDSSISYYK